jgi:predicted Zn-dependent peptidase
MHLDRKVGPEIHSIKHIAFPAYEKMELNNGIPLYILGGSTESILKMEVVFKAGRTYEKSRLLSKVCNQLIKDGTSKYSSEQISEEIDFYGSSISVASGMDHSTISLYCLKKHFVPTLKMFMEVLTDASFPEEEIEKYGIRASQRLTQELSKNNVVAYRKLSELIYGTNHPYGYNTNPEDYKNVDPQKVRTHFHQNYTHKNCNIYLSGAVNEEVIQLINDTLGNFTRAYEHNYTYSPAQSASPKTHEISGHKLQNSIKIGKKLFNRHHEDYYSMVLLNTVLGGYFGSRLMSEIRENKGYTYNIYSILDPLVEEGCFYISTEVGKEYYAQTMDAIKLEIEKLQNDLVNDKELDMAKNYLLGNFLSTLDGPLKSSRVLKTFIENGLEPTRFEQMIERIKNCSKIELKQLAVRYLDIETMISVSVGDF